MAEKDDELRMTYSCILSKQKKKIVKVTFERAGAYAEGLLPDGIIEKQQGFSEEEVSQLELYLKLNQEKILKKAKGITGIQHWL